MVLSEIEIAGFKSFARKTKIPFRSGMTAVVGPNGCGKTNVVDAIRWVLGEQKTGVLRSDRMENVIFNGSRNRKPLGLAEVTLNLQNTNGLLPIPQSEVRVTRRLFRNGESEYLLNNNVCRLRDIVELFQDTGIGPDSYSIIELKMVEGILSDDPSDRRHLFEEAAGVSKYKYRRKQTAKKLENVHEDLERLGDILREVETHVSHLRAQMRRAKRYQKMKEEWHRGQILFARRNSRDLYARLEIHRKRLGELSGETVRHDGHITGTEAILEQLKAEQLQTENELKSVAGQLSKLESNLIRTEETLKYLKERREAIEENRKRWERERIVLDEKRLRLQENREGLEGKVQQARENHEGSRERLREAQAVLVDVRRRRSDARTKLEQIVHDRDQRQKTYMESFQARSRIEANIERIEEQLSANASQLEQLNSLVQQSCEQVEQARKKLTQNSKELDRVLKELKEAETQFEEQRKSLDKARWNMSESNHRLQNLESQLQWLRTAIGEGSNQQEAVRWLFSQNLPGIIGTLGDIVEAPKAWQSMIAAVLGDESHWVVCDTRTTAIDAIKRLRDAQKGQLTFLPLESIPKQDPAKDIAIGFKGFGVMGSLVAAMTNSEPLLPLLKMRLGSAVALENDPDKELLRSASSAGITLVTSRGDVYWASGIIRGGRTSQDTSSAVGRIAKIRELESNLVQEKEEHDQFSQEVKTLEAGLEARSNEVRNKQSEFENSRNQVEESRIDLSRVTVVIEQYRKQVDKLQQDIADISAQKQELTDKLAAVVAERNENEKMINRLEKQFKDADRELKKIEEQVEVLTTKENQASMAFVEAANHLENLENEYSRINQQLQELDESAANREAEVLRSAQEIEDIDSRRLEAERGLVERFKDRDNFWSSRDRLQEALENLRQQIKQEETRLREARQEHESTTGERHRIELEITRIEGEIQQIHERLRDLDIPLKMIEEENAFDQEVIPSEDDLADLKQKIERMEPVNLLAIEEYETINQRYEFLKSQRDDLVQSREMLEDTIQRINEVAQQKFFETFQVIRRNFQEIFRQLFGDGDADLLLSGQDLLESDISIWANPSGKKLKTLALMSGGEKALTAIGLLFSIYRVKPSPFCVLDEVDAPLDDANINRFINMIRNFSENTQFIVVTHNKSTMEAADQLHGITMEEEGVSKLVSVRLETIA